AGKRATRPKQTPERLIGSPTGPGLDANALLESVAFSEESRKKALQQLGRHTIPHWFLETHSSAGLRLAFSRRQCPANGEHRTSTSRRASPVTPPSQWDRYGQRGFRRSARL